MKFLASSLPILAALTALVQVTIASPMSEGDEGLASRMPEGDELLARDSEPDNNIFARDICGWGYPGYTRRIGSPCKKSNGSNKFCSCDQTNIAKCVKGKWVDGTNCQAKGLTCVAADNGENAYCKIWSPF